MLIETVCVCVVCVCVCVFVCVYDRVIRCPTLRFNAQHFDPVFRIPYTEIMSHNFIGHLVFNGQKLEHMDVFFEVPQ